MDLTIEAIQTQSAESRIWDRQTNSFKKLGLIARIVRAILSIFPCLGVESGAKSAQRKNWIAFSQTNNLGLDSKDLSNSSLETVATKVKAAYQTSLAPLSAASHTSSASQPPSPSSSSSTSSSASSETEVPQPLDPRPSKTEVPQPSPLPLPPKTPPSPKPANPPPSTLSKPENPSQPVPSKASTSATQPSKARSGDYCTGFGGFRNQGSRYRGGDCSYITKAIVLAQILGDEFGAEIVKTKQEREEEIQSQLTQLEDELKKSRTYYLREGDLAQEDPSDSEDELRYYPDIEKEIRELEQRKEGALSDLSEEDRASALKAFDHIRTAPRNTFISSELAGALCDMRSKLPLREPQGYTTKTGLSETAFKAKISEMIDSDWKCCRVGGHGHWMVLLRTSPDNAVLLNDSSSPQEHTLEAIKNSWGNKNVAKRVQLTFYYPKGKKPSEDLKTSLHVEDRNLGFV